MRDSIGGAWLLGIIMVFMVFMIAFVYITIDYNHVYKTKTTIVNVIEQYQGINDKSIKKIQAVVQGNGYVGTNTCNLDNKKESGTYKSKKYECITPTSAVTYNKTEGHKCYVCVTSSYYPKNEGANRLYDEYYYYVEVFLKVDLPVVGKIYTYRVTGATNPVYYPYSSINWNYSS